MTDEHQPPPSFPPLSDPAPTPLLADEDLADRPVRRVPVAAIVGSLLVGLVALGGVAYLARELVNLKAPESGAVQTHPEERAELPVAPVEPAFPEGEGLEARETAAPDSDHPAAAPAAAKPVSDLEALREQVRGLGDRLNAVSNQVRDLADQRDQQKQRLDTLEQAAAQRQERQEVLSQQVAQQERRIEAIVVPTKGSAGEGTARRVAVGRSAGKQGSKAIRPEARPPFTVLGVDQWGGVSQLSISRAQGSAWLAEGESLEGWQVLAIHGREVVWRAPSGQTVTQSLGDE